MPTPYTHAMTPEMLKLCELRDLLRYWPTDRALTAYGAQTATENKLRARAILAELNVPDLPDGWAALPAGPARAQAEVLGENDTVLFEGNTQTECRRFIESYTRNGDFGGWAYLTLRERQDDGSYAIIDTIADPAND